MEHRKMGMIENEPAMRSQRQRDIKAVIQDSSSLQSQITQVGGQCLTSKCHIPFLEGAHDSRLPVPLNLS
jgi:hypothetical protein